MKNIPKKIYLQIGEENDIDDNINHSDNFNKLEGVTWSEDRINSTDIEYTLSEPEFKDRPEVSQTENKNRI